MKNFKPAFYQATLIIAVIIGTSSCMINKPDYTIDFAKDHNDAKFDKNSGEKDAQFLVNAAEINMAEISLGKLSQEKSSKGHA